MGLPPAGSEHQGIDGTRRQPFLDAVARVQRLVAARAPIAKVYQAALDGAVDLLQGAAGSVRLLDEAERGWMVAVAHRGTQGSNERWRRRSPITEGVSGRVLRTRRSVAVEDDGAFLDGSKLAPREATCAVGYPLREHGEVFGALVVASTQAGRRWSSDELATMEAYAEHMSAGLSLARAAAAADQAMRDELTGLANRVQLLDRLEQKLARADRTGRQVSLLFLDLDGFKLINDSLGHSVGDQLLVAVARRIRHCTSRDDVCARLGGDEFAVLLRDHDAAADVARRIIESVGLAFSVEGHEISVRVSVGIVTGREEAETLLRDADVAMYEAKRRGGGCLAHFAPSLHEARLARLGLETELRHAIQREELEIHYQPMVDLQSGEVVAFEALVRWRHPRRGLIPPPEFIPLAEETGLIVEIDRWVLARACGQFATWWTHTPLGLSVNVSLWDLRAPDWTSAVTAAIAGRFPAGALVLEVTESVPLGESPEVRRALEAVKEIGVRVAVDDFGTGYSSLLSLARLPVDILKVPRSLLTLPGDRGRRMIAGIVDLARHLDLQTVGEGVETAEQQEMLTELGCNLGQGFRLGRPAPAGVVSRLLRERAQLLGHGPHGPCVPPRG